MDGTSNSDPKIAVEGYPKKKTQRLVPPKGFFILQILEVGVFFGKLGSQETSFGHFSRLRITWLLIRASNIK